jgi:hypothetical protein
MALLVIEKAKWPFFLRVSLVLGRAVVLIYNQQVKAIKELSLGFAQTSHCF